MSVLQICLLSIIGILAVASIVFMILFVIEITVEPKTKVRKISVKEVIENNKNVEKETQISVDEMLENLEKQSQEDEVVIVENEEVQEEVVSEESDDLKTETEEIVVEIIKEENEESAENEIINEEVQETAESEEKVEEKSSEINKEIFEEDTSKETEKDSDEDDDSADDEDDISEDDLLAYEKIEPEIILAPGTIIDYKARLEKVINGKAKIERDLTKIQKFILKYERTDRRKARNQRMLDRRAGELTNLNLVMYSVTDIKNVDEDKKVKQEELTSHIAELKASIQDAEEYLESNKEKYNHNVKMAKFLLQERVRYSEEIVELEALIKAADENK